MEGHAEASFDQNLGSWRHQGTQLQVSAHRGRPSFLQTGTIIVHTLTRLLNDPCLHPCLCADTEPCLRLQAIDGNGSPLTISLLPTVWRLLCCQALLLFDFPGLARFVESRSLLLPAHDAWRKAGFSDPTVLTFYGAGSSAAAHTPQPRSLETRSPAFSVVKAAEGDWLHNREYMSCARRKNCEVLTPFLVGRRNVTSPSSDRHRLSQNRIHSDMEACQEHLA